MEPLYAVRAGGVTLWTAMLMVSGVAGVVLGVIMAALDSTVGGVVLALGVVLTSVLIWPILPRRYEVWGDRLTLVFPLWRWDIRLDSIAAVRESSKWEPYAYAGWRFATAPSKAVTVERRNGNLFTRPSVVISPDDREGFLRELRAAMSR